MQSPHRQRCTKPLHGCQFRSRSGEACAQLLYDGLSEMTAGENTPRELVCVRGSQRRYFDRRAEPPRCSPSKGSLVIEFGRSWRGRTTDLDDGVGSSGRPARIAKRSPRRQSAAENFLRAQTPQPAIFSSASTVGKTQGRNCDADFVKLYDFLHDFVVKAGGAQRRCLPYTV
jgi:hypothetical protein